MPNEPITSWFNLTGKVALVTGSARGIGQAIAARLAEAGAAVVLTDLDFEEVESAAAAIKLQGGKTHALQVDVRQPEQVTHAIESTLSSFGQLNILVNNAGIYPMSPLLSISLDDWEQVQQTNLRGTFLFSQAAARQMIAAGNGGKIINLASIDGIKPTGNLAHYNASKGGVILLTRALARELGPHNINVNAIAPGGIDTPGSQAMLAQSFATTGQTVEELSAPFAARIPLGRFGQADDVAKAALFLASEASSYITGCVLPVDGGYLVS